MKICEIFYSIQGEIDIGKPVIFIRFSGCNLIGDKKGCQWCDTLYAEKGFEMNEYQILDELKNFDCKNIVITGGEPLMQKEELTKLTSFLRNHNYNLDIETNGTIFDDLLWDFNNINCSPKKQAVDLKVLEQLLEYSSRFKFVYEDKNNLWWEPIIEQFKIDKSRIYIMPEGKTKEEQESKTQEVINYCKTKGYNFSPRAHILIYGSKRGV